MCVGCKAAILDPFHLHVAPDMDWHAACLVCIECSKPLDETCSCLLHEGQPYCRTDYIRSAGRERRRGGGEEERGEGERRGKGRGRHSLQAMAVMAVFSSVPHHVADKGRHAVVWVQYIGVTAGGMLGGCWRVRLTAGGVTAQWVPCSHQSCSCRGLLAASNGPPVAAGDRSQVGLMSACVFAGGLSCTLICWGWAGREVGWEGG